VDTGAIHPARIMTLAKPDRGAALLILGLLFCVTVLQKGAIPLGGGASAFVGLPVILLFAALGWLSGRLIFDRGSSGLLLFAATILLASQLLGGRDFSFASLGMLLTMHLAYLLRLRSGLIEPKVALLYFQKFMAVFAVFGIVQFGGQFIIGQEWAFWVDTKLPSSLLVTGFNSLNILSYGQATLKATGFFFQEPAVLSQFLAISVVIELVYFRHLARFALLLAGIIVTFSGTGLLLLLVLTPFYLMQTGRFFSLAALALLVASAGLWAPEIGLGPIYDRAFEFTNPQSSGYARFLGIFPTLRDHILGDTSTLFLGKGAGSISAVVLDTGFDYMTHNPSWGKLFYEYGLLGLVGYLVFLGSLIWRAPVSGYVRAALTLQFLFLGEYLLPPTVHGLILALLVWPNPTQEKVS
jgi:hypothetical protein